MTALLKIYDTINSNNYVSIGITTCATAKSIYDSYDRLSFYSPPIKGILFHPTAFVISAYVGCIFAFLAKAYLVHNSVVKANAERNSVYSASASFVSCSFYTTNKLYTNLTYCILRPLNLNGIFPYPTNLEFGFNTGFTTTMLVLQVLETMINNKIS